MQPGALTKLNDVDKPGSMRADNADSPATPTSQLPATRTRLYDNLRLSEERDPLKLAIAKIAGEDRVAALGPAIAAAKTGDLAGAARLTPIGCNHQPDFWETTTPEIRTMFLDNARTWTLALAAPPQPPITCDMLHQIKIPVLITVGRDTRSYFHIAAEGAAGCIPGIRFVTIPGRHLAIAQKPEAFNAALLQLLATAGSQPKP